jgi:hypothetical protein
VTVTTESFRAHYQALSDPGTYDDDSINMFISIAGMLLNVGRWGAALDLGTELFVAHHLVLMARDNATVDAGGIPGSVQGIINSKSVDKVAAAYDTAAVQMKDGNFWNMTTYGIRFAKLARWMGSGGMQVSGGCGVGAWGGFLGVGWPE